MAPHLQIAKTALIKRIRGLASAQRAVVPLPDVVRVFCGNHVFAMTHGQAIGDKTVGETITIDFIND